MENNYKNYTSTEIKKEIERLKELSKNYKNEEMGIKLTLNSIYGALGNQWFAFFNPEVAEAVTLQGQDLIKYAEKIINKYFQEHWHLDTELHEILGARNVKPIIVDMVVYIDTDSNYVNFGNVINSCEFDSSPLEFVTNLDKYRLNDYLKKCLDIYASKWGTKNYQDFELESISKNGIFLGKKKYVVNLSWESPGHDQIEDLTKIKYTGVEMIVGGTAPFARERLKGLIQHFFEKGKNFDIRAFVKMLRVIKSDFKIQKPEDISVGTSVNKLEEYILCDTTRFEVAKKCPMHVRAAGYHNYVLNNSKYKQKYTLIRSSDKIKDYYVKVSNERENNVFGYLAGSYPYEYAPPIDMEEQFNRCILDPINRFLEAMGYTPLGPNLLLVHALF